LMLLQYNAYLDAGFDVAAYLSVLAHINAPETPSASSSI
jgi:hypothetical protein